jgi:hypothetical protein
VRHAALHHWHKIITTRNTVTCQFNENFHYSWGWCSLALQTVYIDTAITRLLPVTKLSKMWRHIS